MRTGGNACWLRVALAVLIPCASAYGRWIRWQPSVKSDSGALILSTNSDLTADGLPQIYHYWKMNFEAAIKWRKGDVLSVDRTGSQLSYEVGADASEPLRIEMKLSHVLGYAPLECVEATSDPVIVSVYCGDDDTNDPFYPNQVAYQIELFKEGQPVPLQNLLAGIDYQAAPGMTFSHTPTLPVESESVSGKVWIDGTKGRVVPTEGSRVGSHLYCSAFGRGAPTWDTVVLTLSDNTGSGIIRKGLKFRFFLSGVPLVSSIHPIPATSDPLPAMILYDKGEKLSFTASGIRFAEDAGTARMVSTQDGDLVGFDFAAKRANDRGKIAWELSLLADRRTPSSEYINLILESEDWINYKPANVLNFEEFVSVPVAQLMAEPWSRLPEFDFGSRPMGRPLWESSIALCDKSDPNDRGIAVESASGKFWARHINQRRVLFGSIDGIPAIWRQRTPEPEAVSVVTGIAEGANDLMTPQVVGYVWDKGETTPCLWNQTEGSWETTKLSMGRFYTSGKAHDINDAGTICGVAEILIGSQPNPVPCIWKPNKSGGYISKTRLPIPEAALGGSALAINRLGNIGGYYIDGDDQARACLWQHTGTGYQFVDLGTFGVARGINDLGQIVGGSDTKSFIWQGEQRFELRAIKGAPEESRVLGITHMGEILLNVPGEKPEGGFLDAQNRIGGSLKLKLTFERRTQSRRTNVLAGQALRHFRKRSLLFFVQIEVRKEQECSAKVSPKVSPSVLGGA